jgi:hypothetical protein
MQGGEELKTKSEKLLPKTAAEIQNGGIYSQAVRCGKSNCKCALGERHRAFYFFTRRNGKLVKFYIRKAELSLFSSLVIEATAERKAQRWITKDDLSLLKQMHNVLRERASLINSLKGK